LQGEAQQMKVIKVNYIPFEFTGFTVWPFIFFLRGRVVSNTLLRHEYIHGRQQRETLWRAFFMMYLLEFFIKLIYHRSFYTAYYSLSFERECYQNAHNENYLKKRKPFAWVKHIYEK
jgi:hypothetical protein